MMLKNIDVDYWFTIEPYVYVKINNNHILLYNTLDGVTIESEKIEIIELLRETLLKENCGVIFLENKRYMQKIIKDFIYELREKYMGDIIDVSLSKGKPIQILPFFNLSDKQELYKKNNFSPYKNILDKLYEISIHVDSTFNVSKFMPFLLSIPDRLVFNIVGNLKNVENYTQLLSFFDQHPSPKNLICSYIDIMPLRLSFDSNFSYRILVDFPIDKQQLENSSQLLHDQFFPFEYTFYVSSFEDCQQAEQLIDQLNIEKYHLNPVYTGKNIEFFEKYVFLNKEDILSTPMTTKDIFCNQSINIYDFGKINIMSNGDAYANVSYPALGNIYMHSIHEIVYKEVEFGKSWLRIRNQKPCTSCTYQWLCPPPSNYELAIGRSNLCHIK